MPVADFYECKVQNSQLGLVQDQAKFCVPDDTEVTVLNKQFVQYMQEHTVSAVMGQVGKYHPNTQIFCAQNIQVVATLTSKLLFTSLLLVQVLVPRS